MAGGKYSVISLRWHYPSQVLGRNSQFPLSLFTSSLLYIVYKYVTGLILTQEGIFVKKIGDAIHYQGQRMFW